MEMRPISGTRLNVSTICLGTMTFGTPVGEADAVRMVHWAIDSGINFIDTADIYEGYKRFLGSPGGVAEDILGKALEGRRQQAIITTKVGNPVGGAEYEGTGLGRAHVLHQIEHSLRRLRTEYVDFYEMHRPDPETPMEESIATMAELITVGKVRYWGFSNFDGDQIRGMVKLCDENGWPRPVISQQQHSWLSRDIEAAHLPVCREAQISVTPFKALEGGLLTGKYRRGEEPPSGSRAVENPGWKPDLDDAVFDRIEAFEQEARDLGLTPARYAVQWLLNQPGISSVILGAKRIEQIEELL